ncbi:MAG: transporter substrate binding protein precursor [Chloroflexi bacterium]|nr:transporter substrate binding protein precursor [Chloroflexota bacterium]
MSNKFNKIQFQIAALTLALALSLILSACQSATPSEATEVAPAEPVTLKLALLPIIDTLPILVAQQEGLFEANNVNVEVIPVASAAERDQVITSGQADGMINEALSTMFYNKDQTQVQIVRFARASSPEHPLFWILASATSGINSADGLKNVEIGVSEGTIIEYITDRLLEKEGLSSDEIKNLAVPKIPDRIALLGTGQLKAATLPDPAASLAMQQGAMSILDDSKYPELSLSTLAFRKPFIDQNPQAIQNFLKAIEEAVVRINEDPAKYTNLLVEQKVLPAPLAETFQVPPFITAGVPDEAHWNDVLAWAKAEGLLAEDVSYSESVTTEYLP